VILEERQPAFAWVTSALDASQVPGYAPFRDHEAELLKLSVDLGGSPIRVLLRETPDQPADLIGDLRPALGRRDRQRQ